MMTSTNPTLDGTVQGAPAASDRKCLACDWTGPALATRMFGTLSALCPDCGRQTAAIDCNAEVIEALGVCAIACADTHPELCAGIVAQLAPDNVAVLDTPAPREQSGEALLPCPFCAGTPAMRTDGESGYWIECTNPACGSSTNMRIALMDDVRTMLAEQWNRRASAAIWNSAASLPDDDIVVLLELSDGEVWPGFRDADVWRYVTSEPIESVNVTGWMHMPPGRTASEAPAQAAPHNALDCTAAVAAIAFALEDDDGMDFLRYWNEGEFDVLRREWPDAPEAVYIGADPLHPGTRFDVYPQVHVQGQIGGGK